ncbi:hypothetical protein Sgly_0826 [Syntrophobotulus glycolicus DSM 8271]|uniref:DUF4829 domain-containing protein n=1 Tax=Syntrophobotulus glycolicus (strain DSM 8271 / FlGlyR) TaxID=645991 RepID=F0T1B3_SYNGF|nr:DUF4829 domain-containing protein [Syntrophobotulus glycolicus]ADY55177.1 hypothetical protein Sgly_0826 [Syntrophobotulus glycolicus DSM 8271]
MKKFIPIACVGCLVVFGYFLLNLNAKGNPSIDIGKSTKFSQEEIQAAVDCVIVNFKEDFKGCNLKKIWYDEGESDSEIGTYMIFGRGSVNGVKEENVIVLFSNFDVGTGADASLNPNSTYKDWNWILIREDKTGNWKIDDWGY